MYNNIVCVTVEYFLFTYLWICAACSYPYHVKFGARIVSAGSHSALIKRDQNSIHPEAYHILGASDSVP